MPPPSTPTMTTVSASSIVPLAAVDETKAIELGGQSTGSVSTRVALPASAVAASFVCTRPSSWGRPCRSRVHSRQASTLAP